MEKFVNSQRLFIQQLQPTLMTSISRGAYQYSILRETFEFNNPLANTIQVLFNGLLS